MCAERPDLGDVPNLPVKTVHQYARQGVLPSIKLGRHRRFLLADVERAVAGLRARS
jgi:excisionase family DNA binding protein